MTEFAKRPYRELVADTQEARDQYYAALREYYRRVQIESIKPTVRVPRFRSLGPDPVATTLVIPPSEPPATPPPPELPPQPVPEPEPEPAPAAIETIPENRSIPETGKRAATLDELLLKSEINEILSSESRFQRGLIDRAAFYCRQFLPDWLPFSRLPIISSHYSYGESWPGRNEFINLSRRRKACSTG